MKGEIKMQRTINYKFSKNPIKTFKAKIYDKIMLYKQMNEEYDNYIYNAIMEAEESLARGERTHTLEELEKIWDEEDDEKDDE